MKTDSEKNCAEIEDMIDHTSLSEVLAWITGICYEKAEHLRSNWQDELAAKEWEKAAKLINAAVNRVNV